MSEITRNPLCWPNNVPRTAPHLRGRPGFKDRSLAVASFWVRAEINRLNNDPWNCVNETVIISSNLRLKQDGFPMGNQGEPADTGIAVYFPLRFKRNGKVIERPVVLTCDKWAKTSWNLYAIGKDIEAQRARDRWGATNIEQAYRGYLAIRENCGGKSWWELLNVKSTASEEQIKDAYRALTKIYHPDAGGDVVQWNQLQEAYDQALAGFRRQAA